MNCVMLSYCKYSMSKQRARVGGLTNWCRIGILPPWAMITFLVTLFLVPFSTSAVFCNCLREDLSFIMTFYIPRSVGLTFLYSARSSVNLRSIGITLYYSIIFCIPALTFRYLQLLLFAYGAHVLHFWSKLPSPHYIKSNFTYSTDFLHYCAVFIVLQNLVHFKVTK